MKMRVRLGVKYIGTCTYVHILEYLYFSFLAIVLVLKFKVMYLLVLEVIKVL